MRFTAASKAGSGFWGEFLGMATPAISRADAKRLKHELADLRESILEVTLSWGSLEESMSRMLGMLVRGNHYEPIGPAIYFASDNSGTRFAIVDAAFRATFEDAFIGGEVAEMTIWISIEWRAFVNALGRRRMARNAIIHNVIQKVEAEKSKRETYRLAPSRSDYERRARVKAGQLPGFSASDVEGVAEKIKYLKEMVKLFERAAQRLHQKPEELRLSLAELKAHRLKYGGPVEDGQTPPEP
jgi:hypothetical protein